jgi:hypothetical protein
MDKEMLRKHIADEFMAKRMALAKADYKPAPKPVMTKEVQVASMMTNLDARPGLDFDGPGEWGTDVGFVFAVQAEAAVLQ